MDKAKTIRVDGEFSNYLDEMKQQLRQLTGKNISIMDVTKILNNQLRNHSSKPTINIAVVGRRKPLLHLFD